MLVLMSEGSHPGNSGGGRCSPAPHQDSWTVAAPGPAVIPGLTHLSPVRGSALRIQPLYTMLFPIAFFGEPKQVPQRLYWYLTQYGSQACSSGYISTGVYGACSLAACEELGCLVEVLGCRGASKVRQGLGQKWSSCLHGVEAAAQQRRFWPCSSSVLGTYQGQPKE